jgi:hypothetical protein
MEMVKLLLANLWRTMSPGLTAPRSENGHNRAARREREWYELKPDELPMQQFLIFSAAIVVVGVLNIRRLSS